MSNDKIVTAAHCFTDKESGEQFTPEQIQGFRIVAGTDSPFSFHGKYLAVSHFGPRLFGMRHYGTDISVPETFRYRDISVPGTFRPRDISAPETFRYRDISVPWTFRYWDISVPETFRYRDILVPGTFRYQRHFGTRYISGIFVHLYKAYTHSSFL